MLLDKITLATRRVDFVDIQVTIWARHEKIVISPDLMNGAKMVEIVFSAIKEDSSPDVLEPARMQFRRCKVSALL